MKDRSIARPSPLLKLYPIGLLALSLGACATIPGDAPRETMMTARSAGLAPGATPRVQADWWTGLSDPQLNSIMIEALAGSPTLSAAIARIRRADAALAEQRSALSPQITADASGQVERLSGQSMAPPPFAGTVRFVGSAEAGLSWSLDLAGRQKSRISAARFTSEAALLDAAAAREALAGAIGQAYVELARAEARRGVADLFVQSRSQKLELARIRKHSGLASDFEIEAVQTLLAQARQQRQRAEAARERAVHALAALAGRGPDYYPALSSPARLSSAALELPQSVPADLLSRRADIRAAQARIEAAGAQRSAARADFFPDVDLKAFIGVAAIGLGSLFGADALTAGAGPALHLPIFDGGRLRARYRGATAEVDLAITAYNEAVLDAVRDCSDDLTSIALNAADRQEQDKILAGLQRTMRLDQVRFRAGLGSRLDVLSAEERLLAAREEAVDLEADGHLARIRLITALGGGFAARADDPRTPNQGS